MITKKQKRVLDFIQEYSQKKGFSPSHDEIRKHLKLSSVSTVNHYMKILQEKGYIKREKNAARSAEVEKKESLMSIPFKGYISAGQPIEAVEEYGTITVPSNLVSSGEHFALGVKGDSMIDEGIFDGDTVVIRKQNTVEDGETAVALINGNEVTLKKIYREKNRIRLQPANPKLKHFFVKSVVIQGKVISTFRNLEEQAKKEEKFKFNQFLCGDVLDMMNNLKKAGVNISVIHGVGDKVFPMDEMQEHVRGNHLDGFYSIEGRHGDPLLKPERYAFVTDEALSAFEQRAVKKGDNLN